MKKTLLLLFLFNAYYYALAQPSIQWQKTFGGSNQDYAYTLNQTTDGGYIVTGWTDSHDGDVTGTHGLQDFWILKLDNLGTIQWQKTYGGSKNDEGTAIQQTTDGGYIVAGLSYSNDGDLSGNHGDMDYWILKLSSTGTIEWQKSLGGTSQDYGYDIKQTSDGGYIMTGWSKSNNGDVSGNHGGFDCWVVKLTGAGAIQWQKSFGGAGEDWGVSIQQTNEGGYILGGLTSSNDGDVSGNHGSYDYWVVKMDGAGGIEWQKTLGGSGDDRSYSIQPVNGGGYIVAGYSTSTNGDVTGNHGTEDYWIVKLSDNGTIQKQKSFGGTKHDVGTSARQTKDGGFIISGATQSNNGDVSGNHGFVDIWVVKVDNDLNLEWQKSLGGSGDESGQAIQTTDDGYVVFGRANSNDGNVTGHHGNGDYWIVKLGAFTPVCGDFKAMCFHQGPTYGGEPVVASRSVATKAETAQKSDAAGNPNFFSLGFGGFITLKSSCPVNNGEGNDIKVWETTFGAQPINANSDRAKVFASQDGVNFRYLGTATYDGTFDLAVTGWSWAQYFRIVDATIPSPSLDALADGYDVDGLEVLNGYINDVTAVSGNNAAAASVCGGSQGKNKDFSPVAAIRSYTDKATGLPQNTDSYNFYSLGFGGDICLKFDYAVFDGPGGELQLVETTFGSSTCDQNRERAEVAVSYDGNNWVVLGEYCQDYTGTIDLTPANSGIQFVRVRDISLRSDFTSSSADGYDIDAVANVSAAAVCPPAASRRAVNETLLFDQTTVPEEIQGLQIVANPVSDRIQLRFSMVTELATVTICDQMGRKVAVEPLTGYQWELKEITLPVSHLPAGVYFITLDGQVQKETKPFIKR